MVTETTINGNLVYRDDNLTHRWYDAVGPEVCKLTEHFVNTPFSAADQMAGWLATLIEVAGNSTAALVGGSLGGELLLTGATNDNDGIQAQLLGEAFYFAQRYPTYFGCRFKVTDADQTDVIAGLCITDSTLLGGLSNGLYFRLVDESTTLEFVAEKGSVETVLKVATLVDATWVVAEFLYSGGIVYVYINGNQVAELADSCLTFPNAEYLTPSLGMLNGAAGDKTVYVDFINAIQVQST